jgi:4-hydroxybenzoate polyprenyltransferase
MNAKNIAAYFQERFPPINMMLFGILFFTVYSVAVFDTSYNPNTLNIVIGVIATISFFFRLRVFDEMKDFEIDAVNHPNRVLQSGRVSIKQLVTIALQLLPLEFGWSIWNGPQTLLFWSIAVVYSLLMRYEFFVSHFLKKYLLLYSFTHMLIMPLIIMWIWSAFVPETNTTSLLLLCLLSILGGYSFELARKIHAPSGERVSVDSYSKSLGFVGSIVTVCLCLLTGIAVQIYLLRLLNSRPWPYYVLGLLFLFTLIIYLLGIKSKKEKQFRTAEIFVSLFMLISYVSIIVEIQFK